MHRTTAAAVTRTAAAAAIERVFEEYLMPISFAEPVYALHVATNDIDPAESPIWVEDGRVVAAALLGVRGRRGWIGGFGVALSERGRGLGGALLSDVLERSRARGLETLALEALVQNERALQTYRSGGFRQARRLRSFAVAAGAVVRVSAEVPYTAAEPLLDAPDTIVPCWQREPASLHNQGTLHAVGDARAFCVFRHNGEDAQLLKVRAANAAELAMLTASVIAQTGAAKVELINEPAAGALSAAAGELGWPIIFEQYEMMRDVA
jgi:ribosomal protein S18 acetylase RimI-like enzyme